MNVNHCHFTLPRNQTSDELINFFDTHYIDHRFNTILVDGSLYFAAPMPKVQLVALLRESLPHLHRELSTSIIYHDFVQVEKKVMNPLRIGRKKITVKPHTSERDIYSQLAINRAHFLKETMNFNDPAASAAWQYLNDGETPYSSNPGYDLNLFPVYVAGYSGRGIKVVVIDDAVDSSHKDLRENIDMRLTKDLVNSNRRGPRGTDFRMKEDDSHGTMCASVVAAVANNSLCSFGVSFNAKLGAIRLLGGHVSDLMIGESFVRFSKEVQIYTSSWGPTDNGKAFGSFARYTNDAIIRSLHEGNDGKGVLYFFPAGNGGIYSDNCGADGFINHYGVMAITSIDEDGDSPDYTESCPAITIAVPTTGTPDPMSSISIFEEKKISLPAASINNHCTDKFVGTSAANPIVAGCVALALEANPSLTWRDVHSLLSFSGRIPNTNSRHWFVNGGGMLVNPKLGAGLLNVARLVNLALNWKNLGPLCITRQHLGESWDTKSMKMKSITQLERTSRRLTTLYRMRSKTFTFNVNSPIGEGSCKVGALEVVRVRMQWVHWRRGALKVGIKSPSGLKATLSDTRVNDKYSGAEEMNWKSLMHVGESINGQWKIMVYDKSSDRLSKNSVGFIKYLSIEFRGSTWSGSAFNLNKNSILSHWNSVNLRALKSRMSHALTRAETTSVYDFQKWDALFEEVPPKSE